MDPRVDPLYRGWPPGQPLVQCSQPKAGRGASRWTEREFRLSVWQNSRGNAILLGGSPLGRRFARTANDCGPECREFFIVRRAGLDPRYSASGEPHHQCRSDPRLSPGASVRLRNAHQVEALTANLISVNRRYKCHAGLRVTDV